MFEFIVRHIYKLKNKIELPQTILMCFKKKANLNF